jgi:erythritol kinase
MIAAVAIGAEPDMAAALDRWVSPLLGAPEPPDPGLALAFDRAYDDFRALRGALRPLWPRLARGAASAGEG